ncbi:protein of unknown function [Pseudodesulfovibrio profundus]|uniref:Uncharacterized protein n=1 Tax=Pseudodesulfovibrio profundus TaxID=57320 RepID=A0A2C8FBY8_9BACT|nr:hypothetical protein [Pseudodesulfovibrio profundus]SOB60046.1 protein of unknown function [Pseudodesulfovibrio profundus]
MPDTIVSLKKKTIKVGLALCERSRNTLNRWAENGIQKPTALYSSIRLTYHNPNHCTLDIPRDKCVSVQFVMPVKIRKYLNKLAKDWGRSRSEAADICIFNAENMVRYGTEVPLSTIMPLTPPED